MRASSLRSASMRSRRSMMLLAAIIARTASFLASGTSGDSRIRCAGVFGCLSNRLTYFVPARYFDSSLIVGVNRFLINDWHTLILFISGSRLSSSIRAWPYRARTWTPFFCSTWALSFLR